MGGSGVLSPESAFDGAKGRGYMQKVLKLATLLVAAVAGLAFAGNALAKQQLTVSQSGTSVTIRLSQADTDPQPAKITIWIPSGYTLNTSAAPGAKIGTTTGTVVARDVADLHLPLTGDVVVDDPAKHLTDPCSPGTHAAVWILALQVAGQSVNLPVYVTSPTTGADAALGGTKLETCLGPVDVPQGTPGRSPNGAQLLNATFTVTNTLTPPTASTRWVAAFTPWGTRTGQPNPAGTVETLSFVGPGSVSLNARVTNKARKIATFSGRVQQGGAPVAGARVEIVAGTKRFPVRTNANGTYSLRLQNRTRRVTRTFFQARVTVGARDVTAAGCASPPIPATLAPGGCVSATAGGFTAASRRVSIRI
jgi:hypothetical protein